MKIKAVINGEEKDVDEIYMNICQIGIHRYNDLGQFMFIETYNFSEIEKLWIEKDGKKCYLVGDENGKDNNKQ